MARINKISMKNIILSFLIVASTLLKAQENNSIPAEIKNIGNQINSPFLDYSPRVTADASMLIFTSRRPLSKSNLFKSKDQIYHSNFDRNKKEWLDGIPFSERINVSSQNNIAAAISNDGQRILICRKDKNGNGDIYETVLSGWEWAEPVSIAPQINSGYDESSASITPDGKTIFFVSNRRGGFGGYDIWYCMQKSDGSWSQAINLGAPINTKNDEVSVFFHPDGKTLFFSSNGANSIGGYDVFMSVFNPSTIYWSKPKNLGPSINSTSDDLDFIMEANGKTGYFSTIRLGGLGEKDIYQVTFPIDFMKTDLTVLVGHVTDKKGKAIEAKISVKDKSTDKLIGIFNANSATGKYLVTLQPGKNYVLEFTAEDYFEFNDSIEISSKPGFEEVTKDVVLKSKKVIQGSFQK